ncbi:MAG: 6-phosphogluconolactonase [Pseudomonadota bacterium]
MSPAHTFQSFESEADLQRAAAAWLAAALKDAIARRGTAVFMGSGGRTPGPVYTDLSRADLDWSRVQVGLCDERWVDRDHAASNGAMLERTLLQNRAQAAVYVPMKTLHADPFEAIDAVNERYLDASLTDVMLLGMGTDGHTLSWFAGARGYAEAVDPESTSIVAAIEAIESEVTGPNRLRMTLTLPCISYARNILLLITGKEKRRVFETASDDAPISFMRQSAGRALTVFYCD